jgi:hypothetical protein
MNNLYRLTPRIRSRTPRRKQKSLRTTRVAKSIYKQVKNIKEGLESQLEEDVIRQALKAMQRKQPRYSSRRHDSVRLSYGLKSDPKTEKPNRKSESQNSLSESVVSPKQGGRRYSVRKQPDRRN